MHTLWERAARRAGLPLAYSHGFHPQPKIQLASPLPLGFSSRCELVDMRLNEDVELSDLAARLQAAMPDGIRILGIEPVDATAPALPAQVVAAEYQITFTGDVNASEMEPRIENLLASESLRRERRGKSYDLRPLIEELDMTSDKAGRGVGICMRLSAREGATGRPEEVLDALGIPGTGARVERTALIIRG